MTSGHTRGTVDSMTAKVTLSFSDQTIAEARQLAEREGVSLSAWINRAAQERAIREVFEAHAAAVHRAGWDEEAIALANEQELAEIDAEYYAGRGRAAR